METRYLRLNYGDALSAKKELLSSELNTLSIGKKLKSYRSLRKQEFILKGKIKTVFSSLKAKINLVLSTFPEEGIKLPKPRVRKKERKQERSLQDELAAIQEKLRRLK